MFLCLGLCTLSLYVFFGLLSPKAPRADLPSSPPRICQKGSMGFSIYLQSSASSSPHSQSSVFSLHLFLSRSVIPPLSLLLSRGIHRAALRHPSDRYGAICLLVQNIPSLSEMCWQHARQLLNHLILFNGDALLNLQDWKLHTDTIWSMLGNLLNNYVIQSKYQLSYSQIMDNCILILCGHNELIAVMPYLFCTCV